MSTATEFLSHPPVQLVLASALFFCFLGFIYNYQQHRDTYRHALSERNLHEKQLIDTVTHYCEVMVHLSASFNKGQADFTKVLTDIDRTIHRLTEHGLFIPGKPYCRPEVRLFTRKNTVEITIASQSIEYERMLTFLLVPTEHYSAVM